MAYLRAIRAMSHRTRTSRTSTQLLSAAKAGEQERQANSRNSLWPYEQKYVLLVSFILFSVHQVPSSATSVSVLVLWWFEAGSEVQDGVGGSK